MPKKFIQCRNKLHRDKEEMGERLDEWFSKYHLVKLKVCDVINYILLEKKCRKIVLPKQTVLFKGCMISRKKLVWSFSNFYCIHCFKWLHCNKNYFGGALGLWSMLCLLHMEDYIYTTVQFNAEIYFPLIELSVFITECEPRVMDKQYEYCSGVNNAICYVRHACFCPRVFGISRSQWTMDSTGLR